MTLKEVELSFNVPWIWERRDGFVRSPKGLQNFKQDGILVRCVPPACQPYVLPVSVTTTRCHSWRGSGCRWPIEQVWTGLQWRRPDVIGRGGYVQGGGYVRGEGWVCPEVGGTPTMLPIPWCMWCYLPLPCPQTDACENITFGNKICGSVRMTYNTNFSLKSFF